MHSHECMQTFSQFSTWSLTYTNVIQYHLMGSDPKVQSPSTLICMGAILDAAEEAGTSKVSHFTQLLLQKQTSVNYSQVFMPHTPEVSTALRV